MTIMMGVTSYQRVTSRCSHWMEVRGVTNSWLRQNRISEYGQKWVIFVFLKRKAAFFEHQIQFSE